MKIQTNVCVGGFMIDETRLKILTESAKYDVSCSSSGSARKNAGGIGNAAVGGICHSFTEDGRCISLLKILMSNDCAYDCLYCVNRRSNDVPRATASPEELCELIINFYKRNYIEGLFLSSAVIKNPNYTMEMLYRTVKLLREKFCFNGYIHLKGIPGADESLILEAGKIVDRMSFNLELPSEKSLKLLAPQKNKETIITPMKKLKDKKLIVGGDKRSKFLPAGQTTQMIVGASNESDGQIVKLTEALYKKFSLKRVYYSSYIPMNKDVSLLPVTSTGLMREHRLYQADWLIRFYGFSSNEIADENENLDMEVDPKCSWAIKHPEFFPIEINTAPLEVLIRVPGIGLKSAYKIIASRRWGKITYENLAKMRVVMKRAKYFITVGGKFFGINNHLLIKQNLLDKDANYQQLSMLSDTGTSLSVLTGEL